MNHKIRLTALLLIVALTACTGPDPSPTPPPGTQMPSPEPRSEATEQPAETTPSEEWMSTQPVRNKQGYWEVEDVRGHVMVLIPAGTFTMGFTDDQIVDVMCPIWEETCQQWEIDGWNSMGAHSVTLTRSFWLDKYEVSVALYQDCVDEGFCEPTDRTTYNFGDLTYDTSDSDLHLFPILTGNYERALRYCGGWRQGRLPTEAEWEYAARGHDQRLWPWGDDFPTPDRATFREQGNRETLSPGLMPVDAYPMGQSPFGLFNMAGNVQEWTSTRAYWPYPDEAVQDPVGPLEGDEIIVRGGGYTSIEKEITVSIRDMVGTSMGGQTYGVRCARSVTL